MNQYMELALNKASQTANAGLGGPFGAVVVDKDGTVLSIESNSVLSSHDPTAHAEVNAIRKASLVKGTHDLSGCTMYATGQPCPMCLGAMVWANITKCYYALGAEDAEAIGFRDDMIYKYIREGNGIELDLQQIDRERCLILYEEYRDKQRQMY